MPPIRKFRISLALFIIGLVLSGISAFPLVILTDLARYQFGTQGCCCDDPTFFDGIHYGLIETYDKYPWIGYGTDWLGFGHFVIALFFIAAYRHPQTARGNLWCGIAACIAVIPFALIAGPVRDIPMDWRLVDCSFGVIGMLPLIYCLRLLPSIRTKDPGSKATS